MNKLALFAATALAAAAPAQANVVGSADTSSSLPFGYYTTYFQQAYAASNFSGPVTISNISFYNTLSPSTATPLNDTFTIYLSTTSEAIPSFDTSAMNYNLSSFTQVFSGKVSVAGGRMDISFDTPFTYNPSQGNLMMTVRDFDYGSGGNLFLDADKNTGISNMRWSLYPYDFNQGLVTGFNELAAPVPEPGEWAMLGAGLGVAGLVARRRKSNG